MRHLRPSLTATTLLVLSFLLTPVPLSGSAGASTTYQPDESIKLLNQSTWRGDNVYNTTGFHQTSPLKVERTTTSDFTLRTQNDGTSMDSIALSGCGDAPGFSVHYVTSAGRDITAAVNAGTFVFSDLAAGGSKTITLAVSVLPVAKVSMTLSCPVTATSQSETSKQDVVRARVEVVPTGVLGGYLLIADRGNDRAILVNSRKQVIWRYPRPGTIATFPFNFDDDTFFTPTYRGIISNQEEQQTIQVFSYPQGKVLWTYGHVNQSGSSPGYLYTPDDAYQLPNGTRTVADVGNCRVLFISPAKHAKRQIGTTGVCQHDPPRYLASPNGDTPMPNGATLVTEIGGSWIDAIGPRGKLLWSVRAPVSYPSDAQWLGNRRILLADYSSPGHILIMTTAGKVLWRYGPSTGPGELNHPSLAMMLPNGRIAVNDDFRDRVVIIDRKTHGIVWQYGRTDQPGAAAGYLRTPDGMDFLPFNEAQGIP
jgi:hypothetical protein